MTRRQYARSQSRRSLIWRVFYGSGELAGQGSIVDVHDTGCHVTGRMPVKVGTASSALHLADRQSDRHDCGAGHCQVGRGLEFGLLLDRQMPNLEVLARQKNGNTSNPLDCANPPYKPVGGGPQNRA